MGRNGLFGNFQGFDAFGKVSPIPTSDGRTDQLNN